MASKDRVGSAGQVPLQDSSGSESEPDGVPARPAGSVSAAGALPRSQVIHSGHFMVSSPHSDSAARRRRSGGSLRYDFDTVNGTGCHTYRYGPRSSGSLSIDPTLTRLFECMSLAYRWVPVVRIFPRERHSLHIHVFSQTFTCILTAELEQIGPNKHYDNHPLCSR